MISKIHIKHLLALTVRVDTNICRINLNFPLFCIAYKIIQCYFYFYRTLVTLMLVELWKEIQLEYTNSLIHNFTNVTVNDTNLERRGNGSRMVFHCQGIITYKNTN